MTEITDFVTLRNLAFYSDFSPSYFYFSSLLNYEMPNNDQYNKKAKEIGNAAKSMLSNYPSFADDDETLAVEQLDKLIAFIEQAVKTEQQNEVAYFQNKIKTFKHTEGLKDEPIIKELEQYLNIKNFQYDKIITLINILLQGTENTEGIVQYEIEHITDINKQMLSLKHGRRAQLAGLWRSKKSENLRESYNEDVVKFFRKSNDRFNRKIFIDYATHGNLYSNITNSDEKRKFLPGTKKWLSSLKGSVDVTVAHWITEIINRILEDQQAYDIFRIKIQEEYNNNQFNPDKVANFVKQYLIRSVTTYATKHMPDILNNIYGTLNTADLANIMIDNAQEVGELHIEGLYNNFGMFGKTLELFKEVTNLSEMEEASAKDLYEAYLEFREELNKITKTSGKKVTEEQLLLRKALKTGISGEDKYTTVYALIKKLEKLQKALEQRQAEGQEINDTWLKQFDFSVTGKETKERVTIALRLVDGKINIDGKDGLKDQLKRTRAFKNLGGRQSDSNNLDGIIRGLKARTSNSIKKDLIAAVTPLTKLAAKKGLGGQQYVIEAIQTAIENKKVSVGGPTFSEIKQGIQESLRGSNNLNDWIGKLNKKNDFVVMITVDDSVPDLKSAISKMLDHDAEEIADQLGAAIKTATDNYVKEFVDEFYKSISHVKYGDEAFNSYKANSDAFFAAAKKRDAMLKNLSTISSEVDTLWSQYAEEMKKAGMTTKEINKKRKEVINSFKNSFFQSSTMKTYNQYQNNIGFIGGSLGATVLEQINNINEIFTAAGMEISSNDITWLQSAIINCSPISVIGERHKNIIEDYLGAMAAFALFDEGGAEADIINGIMKNLKRGYTTPNILHLYAVNSIYVPGSYVLSKVLEELKACAENAYAAYESQRKGATIAIINPMTDANVPNRGSNIDTNNPPNRDPWGTVADEAAHKVKLKILFLAGLLDIAHDIEKTLSSIQLPA